MAGPGCSISTSKRRGTTTAAGRPSSSRWPAPSPSGFKAYLAKLTYPIRVGTHFNTAFALILALEWASAFDDMLGRRDPRMGGRPVRRRPRLPGVGAGRRRIPVAGADRGAVHGADAARSRFANGSRPSCRAARTRARDPVHPATSATAATARSPISTGSTSAAPGAGGRSLLEPPAAERAHATARCHFDAALPHVAGDYAGEHWLASFALLAAQA
jgi:hypothetical protein